MSHAETHTLLQHGALAALATWWHGAEKCFLKCRQGIKIAKRIFQLWLQSQRKMLSFPPRKQATTQTVALLSAPVRHNVKICQKK
jgi:hypothetical protein